MTTDHERRDLADIEALTIEFWYRVDHQNGVGVADLFTEDGVYSVANGQSAGRSAIAESYVQRAARGPRLSRHMQTNLRVTFQSPSSARGLSILTLWADDGEAPLDLKMPISVTDVEDEYVKESEGVWLIRHRHLSQVFLGDRPGVLPMGSSKEPRQGGR
ncbi:MAG TPA: nuclear transport factor 2 family protein [Ilumatobacteraceae bacterium]|nr:nuclear transport factor 2 family protein [Ilumatobacteraceae bacterium]